MEDCDKVAHNCPYLYQEKRTDLTKEAGEEVTCKQNKEGTK